MTTVYCPNNLPCCAKTEYQLARTNQEDTIGVPNETVFAYPPLPLLERFGCVKHAFVTGYTGGAGKRSRADVLVCKSQLVEIQLGIWVRVFAHSLWLTIKCWHCLGGLGV